MLVGTGQTERVDVAVTVTGIVTGTVTGGTMIVLVVVKVVPLSVTVISEIIVEPGSVVTVPGN